MAGARLEERWTSERRGARSARFVSIVPSLAFALVLSLGSAAMAQFTEAELFFELNDTDGDLGLHASIDGEPWVKLEIEAPNGSTLLVVTALGKLAKQGLTQLMLESAEPSFDELPWEAFFRRFPEGRYELELRNSEGEEFETRVRLSHVLAAPPANILVEGQEVAENCDDVANLPVVPANTAVLIDWDPVQMSHPEIGKQPPRPVKIVRYQFFVEQEDFKLGVDLPSDVTAFEVPQAVMNLLAAGVVKFEIIARTDALNNTAVENCFRKQ
jgi:hypothetical protein